MELCTLLAVFTAIFLQAVSAQMRLTEPLGNSSWNYAKPPAVQWRPTKGVSLTELGSLQLSIWGGSTEMHTQLMELGTVDATVRRLPVPAIAATLGPAGDYYFVRLHSASKNKTYTSGKFSITGLTGAFNATMQAELSKGNAVAAANSSSSSGGSVSAGAQVTVAAASAGSRTLNSTSNVVQKTSGSSRGNKILPFAAVTALTGLLALSSLW